MPWTDVDSRPYLMRPSLEPQRTTPLRTNTNCFMRRQHRCGKVFAASKACFVACPTDGSLEPLLALLEAKLAAHGIETVVAVKERAYGQEIVCTKICGRIIESRFCLVILDEVDQHEVSVPNPNVYYEYGLMTALRKHVIPLQQEGMTLAFNIQSQDTVKYNARNMAEEIELAIRDAIAQTEPGHQTEGASTPFTARGVRRRLELAGYVPPERGSAAAETTEDTQFITFISTVSGYLFLAKIDSEGDQRNYLDDLPVLVYRLQELQRKTEQELRDLPEALTSMRKQYEEAQQRRGFSRAYDLERELDRVEKRAPVLEKRLRHLASAYLGFIAGPEVDAEPLRARTTETLAHTTIKPTWNQGQSLRIGDTSIELSQASTDSGRDADEATS